MTTTQNTIEKINQLVSAGEPDDTLLSLIESLPNDVKPQGLEAIITYAITNGMHSMLGLLLSSRVAEVLSEHSRDQLWMKACQEDDPDIVDVFIAHSSRQSGSACSKMFLGALSLQASYAIKNLEHFMSHDAMISALFSHGNDVSSEMIKGFSCYPDFMMQSTPKWIDQWITFSYCNDERCNNVQRGYRREQLRLWLSHQADAVISQLWNAVITHGKAWVGAILKDEGYYPPSVSKSVAYMFIEDGSFDLFELTASHNIIKNGEPLHNALSQLVQMKEQHAFITHLIRHALPASKNFFCRLLGMPYDRLELRKISRDFRRHVKMTVNYEESSSYTQLIYVGLMVDKFGAEAVAQHACYEWQVDCLMLLGFGPMEMMGHVESNEIKSYLLQQFSQC